LPFLEVKTAISKRAYYRKQNLKK